ncbi:MAG TPA: hypothetical protein VNN08_06585 [Thermoanaerobaculia bacterium]|nr:hypothetical protein [Thermoanaerobaculia bacterium]
MEQPEAISTSEARHFLELPNDDLYLLLLPPGAEQEFYSRDGKIARGRAIFVKLFKSMRTTLCEKYGRHADTSKTALDLMVLIAAAISKEFHHEPTVVFAVSALITRISLTELCKPQDPAARPISTAL